MPERGQPDYAALGLAVAEASGGPVRPIARDATLAALGIGEPPMPIAPSALSKGRLDPESFQVFKAEYGSHGNIAKASRAADIGRAVGERYSKLLRADQSFRDSLVAAGSAHLQDLQRMVIDVAEVAHERFTKADRPLRRGEIDMRPQYGALVISAAKNALKVAEVLQHELDAQRPAPVFNIMPPKGLAGGSAQLPHKPSHGTVIDTEGTAVTDRNHTPKQGVS